MEQNTLPEVHGWLVGQEIPRHL